MLQIILILILNTFYILFPSHRHHDCNYLKTTAIQNMYVC